MATLKENLNAVCVVINNDETVSTISKLILAALTSSDDIDQKKLTEYFKYVLGYAIKNDSNLPLAEVYDMLIDVGLEDSTNLRDDLTQELFNNINHIYNDNKLNYELEEKYIKLKSILGSDLMTFLIEKNRYASANELKEIEMLIGRDSVTDYQKVEFKEIFKKTPIELEVQKYLDGAEIQIIQKDGKLNSDPLVAEYDIINKALYNVKYNQASLILSDDNRENYAKFLENVKKNLNKQLDNITHLYNMSNSEEPSM